MTPKNILVLADLTSSFSAIKETCESGISPVLIFSGEKVVVRFDVRTTSRGVRKHIGSYFSYEAAVEAKWGFKRNGLASTTEKEKEALKELAKVSRARMTVDDVIELAPDLLDALLSALPPHEILAETTLELLSPYEEEASRGIKYRVSPTQQSDWLAAQLSKFSSSKDSSSLSGEQPQKQESHEPEIPELSDEEYNKLLGLND